ncbi:MAG TPA: tail fiber protein [Candidatus Bathyarchaeia archaeon]|nr:tail fiber protein [Candidatus Bathyarchaeia archaeon]
MRAGGTRTGVRRLRLCVVVFTAVVALALPAGAQPLPVPELVNYQGLIYLEDGSTDVTGTYDFEFRLYPVSSGSADALWGESHQNVQVARGKFSVLLGAGAEITGVPHDAGVMAEVFKLNAVYLQLRVDTDPAIRIRQQFSSTPHAFSAQNAFTAVHGVPPGTVMPFAGSSVPYGWLPCNGTSYAQADYPALFAAIGTTWGSSGANFNVPNLGGMIPVGITSGYGLAATRGEQKVSLNSSHLPSHNHTYYDKRYISQGSAGLDTTRGAAAKKGTSTETTDPSGSSRAHPNIQPSSVVKYIIKW